MRIGLRPTHIIVSETNEADCLIPGTVYSFEPLGAKAILSVKVQDRIMKVVTSADEGLEQDQRVYLKIDLHKALFFDRESRQFLARCRKKGRATRG